MSLKSVLMNNLVWTPKHPEQSQMWHFMDFASQKTQQTFNDYHALHTWSVEHPEVFWQTLCAFYKITFDTPPREVLNNYTSMMDATWFSGATFNFAQKLLSRRGAHTALISIKENNQRTTLSYEELYQLVAQCAAGLQAIGIETGDRVAALLPNTIYSVIGMLATTSLGAVWSSCSPEFGTQAALDRLGQIKPRALFICDGHQYMGKKYTGVEKIIQLSQSISSLRKTIICPNINEAFDTSTHANILFWEAFLKPASACHFVSLPFNHPVYILYSSGTTGKPKCMMHGAGGTLLQHTKELGLHTDLHSHDNLLFYTTCGWMMWNWMVSGLALGATLTLYDGSPTHPGSNRLFQIIEQEKVSVLGVSARFISVLEKEKSSPKKAFDLSSLRCLLSTGSPLLPKNYDYVYEHISAQIQLSSISGGTDILSCFALGNPILPVYRGELQCLGLGMNVAIFDDQGQSIRGTRGELVCTKPFPSMPVGFWNDYERAAYNRAYFQRFPGLWAHGDFAELTEHNGLIIYGRSDAVLNPGGVRIGTAEIYRQVEQMSVVQDSVVIGQDWNDDERIVLFVKLTQGITLNEEITNDIKNFIRHNASPRHVPAKIIQVADIPRTISGKIVELAVRQVVHHDPVNNLQSLANPEALEYFKNRPELLS